MKHSKSRFISQGAIIAALYVVLTVTSNFFGLANLAIQLRLSEALAILAFFTPAAIPGLSIGCMISNLVVGIGSGIVLFDLIFGTLATLIAAVIAYLLKNKSKWIAPIPNVVLNTITVPYILKFGYGLEDGIPIMMAMIGASEILSCYVLGMALLFWVEQNKKTLRLY